MHRSEAVKILKVKDNATKSEVESAYMAMVREIENINSDDGEAKLKLLNVARDTLAIISLQGQDLVPAVFDELHLARVRQEQLVTRSEANDEISDALSVSLRPRLLKLQNRRNLTGFFSLISAAGLIFREFITDLTVLLPNSLGSEEIVMVELTLLMFGLVLAVATLLQNRKIQDVENLAEALRTAITRKRNINKILMQVFSSENEIEDFTFEMDLSWRLEMVTNVEFSDKSLGSAGKLTLPRDFVDEYIDYLETSGFIASRETEDGEVVYRRLSN